MAWTSERVGAVVSMRSTGGLSVFDPNGPMNAARVSAFASTPNDARLVADALIEQGLSIDHFHPLAISFSGSPTQFKDIFGIRLHRSTRPGGRGRSLDVYTPDSDDAPRLLDLPKALGSSAEGVAIACQPRLIDDAGLPVRGLGDEAEQLRCLPDDLAMSVWGGGLAKIDATGDGIVAALISTGHYRHHFFSERRYRVLPTLLGPGQTHSLQDDHGHGTGEAACLFAAAPNLRLRPIKGLLDPVGDILMTLSSLPRPDLIINSWGYDVDQGSWDELKAEDLNLHNYLRLLEAAIAQATAQGIVVAAAVPRTWQSFPASHPDVLAIGAASHNRQPAMDAEACVVSQLYAGQAVPDFWSQVGDTDQFGACRNALGFVQPTQPGSTLGTIGSVDSIISNDSWAWGDIDQAAFPLAASIIALLMERYRGLPPQAMKALLTKMTDDSIMVNLTTRRGPGTGGLALGDSLAVNDHLPAFAASDQPHVA